MPAPPEQGTLPAAPTFIRVEVTAEEAGTRLDRMLTDRVGSQTRSQIQRLIREGHVQLDGRPLRASAAVHRGDVIAVEIPPPRRPEPAPEALPLTIVYSDPHLVVVDKPAGMVVHPAAGHTGGTLVNALLHHVHDLSGIGGQLRPGIVHRLDRGTSGLMVVAKHDQAHVALSNQFRQREVEKRYTTLVWGVLDAGVTIDLPIGRDPRQRKKISARSARPRAALTRVVESETFDAHSLLQVVIATGRTHQIRVHLSAIGHPVVADPTYGDGRRPTRNHPERLQRALENLERPFLHAARLSFRHPQEDRSMTFTCPLPPDLQCVLDVLRSG